MEHIVVPVPAYTGIIWFALMALIGVYSSIRRIMRKR